MPLSAPLKAYFNAIFYVEAVSWAIGLCAISAAVDRLALRPCAILILKLPKQPWIDSLKVVLRSARDDDKLDNALDAEMDALLRARARVIRDFCAATWRALTSTVLIVVGLSMLRTQSWFWKKSENVYNDIGTTNGGHDRPDTYLGVFYSLALGVALQASVCFLWDLCWRRGGRCSCAWLEAGWRHIVSIYLLCASWWYGFARIGFIILLVRTCAEPLLACAHITYLCLLHRGSMPRAWTSGGLLLLFTVSFAITRLYVFPVKLLGPLTHELTMSPLLGAEEPLAAVFAIAGLYVLLCLDVSWFVSFGITAIRVLLCPESSRDWQRRWQVRTPRYYRLSAITTTGGSGQDSSGDSPRTFIILPSDSLSSTPSQVTPDGTPEVTVTSSSHLTWHLGSKCGRCVFRAFGELLEGPQERQDRVRCRT